MTATRAEYLPQACLPMPCIVVASDVYKRVKGHLNSGSDNLHDLLRVLRDEFGQSVVTAWAEHGENRTVVLEDAWAPAGGAYFINSRAPRYVPKEGYA